LRASAIMLRPSSINASLAVNGTKIRTTLP
jgi:hypothetical protein